MLTAIIVDDDFRDRELLEMMIDKYCFNELRVQGTAANTADAFDLIRKTNPDLVFLDVELGTESGFDLLGQFDEFPFKVIFVTAHDQYAIRAIKFNALDYLLKPVSIDELIRAVKKYKSAAPANDEIRNLLRYLAHPNKKTHSIAVPSTSGLRFLNIGDIIYCEAKKEYTYIYCKDQPVICSSINLGEYESLLEEYPFFRVHHSFLVNKQYVKEYIRGEGGELVLINNTQIPVSRRKKNDVVQWLINN